MIEGVEPPEQQARGHLAPVLAVLFSAISCGATFFLRCTGSWHSWRWQPALS
jgi:hypothetical protein